VLRRPGVDPSALFTMVRDGSELRTACERDLAAELDGAGDPWLRSRLWEDVVNTIKYEGYINKMLRQLDTQAHLDHLEIPPDLSYERIAALSMEAREKLGRMRPATLGQASRIDGVRAGDVAVLTVVLRREREARAAGEEAR
jgi:tRNA uridine 5-carboxymethylaminomethyl modification enzyme